jgi:hypothetical protein
MIHCSFRLFPGLLEIIKQWAAVAAWRRDLECQNQTSLPGPPPFKRNQEPRVLPIRPLSSKRSSSRGLQNTCTSHVLCAHRGERACVCVLSRSSYSVGARVIRVLPGFEPDDSARLMIPSIQGPLVKLCGRSPLSLSL